MRLLHLQKKGNTETVAEDKTPKTEVLASKPRRRLSADYKLKILAEADGCTEKGQIGAILRREGLYSSNLAKWRKLREQGAFSALNKQRGRKVKQDAKDEKIYELERKNQALAERLRQAEAIIDLQKKIAQIMGNPIQDNEDGAAK